MVRAHLPASPLFSVSEREPRTGNFGIRGPPAGMVRAHLPASPLFSVSGREPRAGNFGFGGPPAGMVRAHLPASPLFSVSGREPRAGNFGIRGPPAGMVRAHLPASPLFSVSGREPQAGAGRLFQGAVCSPLTANPCGSVPGSKFFTQIPRRHPGPAGFSKARFAPRSPLTLVAPFRGANSSHKFRANACLRPPFQRRGLLPSPRKPLQFRPGEQILHTNSAPTPASGRLFQGAVCSPLTANPCGSVPGSKFFT